jgi:large subunit ribosomal protein L35
MPKIKTHSGTAKRVKKSASGKLIRERAYTGHMLSKKVLAESATMHERTAS